MKNLDGVAQNSTLPLQCCVYRGQFGIVRRATLRRRNKLPAQYVAVKELLRGDAIELVEEAKKMLEVPNHPNVVRFLGNRVHSQLLCSESSTTQAYAKHHHAL